MTTGAMDEHLSSAADIGARVRQARQRKGMSLRSVANDLGLSASLISQVETGKTSPSVATLYSLAQLLGFSVDEMLGLASDPVSAPGAAPQAPTPLQRKSDNAVIEMENGVRWERLAGGHPGPADSLLVSYQPGATSSIEGKLMQHAGLEYAYMLSGVLTLQLEFETYELHAGDSLHFDSVRPHLFVNHGDEPAQGVWFIVGRREPEPARSAAHRQFPGPPTSAVEILQRLDTLE